MCRANENKIRVLLLALGEASFSRNGSRNTSALLKVPKNFRQATNLRDGGNDKLSVASQRKVSFEIVFRECSSVESL